MDEALKQDLSQKLGFRIESSIPIEHGYVIVLDGYATRKQRVWENLLRVHSDGSVVWRTSPHILPGTFVNVRWQDGSLHAWTGEYDVTVNPESGKIESADFWK